eukprot:TRINITY_DN9741_c0_g1_i1.p1 TRINITY_DN9741_c0_g1~~TRINITY_DN9741_c0_g1_i1.p1  ORF type:complete len:550 (-),score=106.30 TRINITY_DN9741_c0_g1_i1:51-1700(-)
MSESTPGGFSGELDGDSLLQHDVLVEVFSLSTDKDLLYCAAVCTEWRFIANLDVLWKPFWDCIFGGPLNPPRSIEIAYAQFEKSQSKNLHRSIQTSGFYDFNLPLQVEHQEEYQTDYKTEYIKMCGIVQRFPLDAVPINERIEVASQRGCSTLLNIASQRMETRQKSMKQAARCKIGRDCFINFGKIDPQMDYKYLLHGLKCAVVQDNLQFFDEMITKMDLGKYLTNANHVDISEGKFGCLKQSLSVITLCVVMGKVEFLRLALDHFMERTVMGKDKQELVDYLLRLDADEESNFKFCDRLRVAASLERIEVVDFILQLIPSKATGAFDYGEPLLIVAAETGNVDLVAAILKHADLEHIDVRGQCEYTALHTAIIFELPQVVRVFLEAGANPTLRTEAGYDCWDLSQEISDKIKQTEIKKLLKPYASKRTPKSAPVPNPVSQLKKKPKNKRKTKENRQSGANARKVERTAISDETEYVYHDSDHEAETPNETASDLEDDRAKKPQLQPVSYKVKKEIAKDEEHSRMLKKTQKATKRKAKKAAKKTEGGG